MGFCVNRFFEIFLSRPFGREGSEGSKGSKGSEGKVDGASPRGFLRFLSLTAFQAEGCGIALTGDEYKVSVTDSPFCVIWHDRHSGD